MLEFTVYTFNDNYELSLILNGIRHFMGSGSWSTLAHIMLLVLFVLAILKYRRFDPMTYLQTIFLPVILYICFFATPCRLNLTDQYSMETQTVSQVPLGVGAPIWFTSIIEKTFIDALDTWVAPPNTPKFLEVDYFGHARLMAEVSTTNLWSDPSLQQTVREYFENCVLPEMANGGLQIQTLKRSADLMSTISSSNHALFSHIYTASGSQIQSCATVYAHLSGEIATQSSSQVAGSPFSRGAHVFGSRAGNGALIAASYNAVIGSLFSGQQDSMEALFNQNLLINSIRGAMGSISPGLLAVMSEAESKHFTSSTTAALLYIKQLPKIRALFKLVLIALFPVVGAFFLAQSGRPFFYWSGALLWVSLWLPAEAAIHAAHAAQTISDLRSQVGTSGGYSFANNLNIVKWATETSALAGGMMLLITVITGMLIRWAFPTLGASIAGMLQGARGLDRAVTAASYGAVEATGKRVFGLDQDRLAREVLDYGDRLTNQRSFMKDMISGYTGNLYQGTYGDSPTALTSSKLLEQTIGKHTLSMDFSGQSLKQAEATQQSLFSQQSGMQRSALLAAAYTDSKTGGNNLTRQVLDSSTDVQKRAFDHSYAFAMKKLNEDQYTQSWGSEAKQAFATGWAATVSVGGNFAGIGVGGNVNSHYENLWSDFSRSIHSKVNTESNSADVSSRHSVSQDNSVKNAVSAALADSIAKNKSETVITSDAISSLQSRTHQYNIATARKDVLQASVANGSKVQIVPSEILGRFNQTGINSLVENIDYVRANQHEPTHVLMKGEMAQFTNIFTKAVESTNANDWHNLFSRIQAYRVAAAHQGDKDLSESLNRVSSIAVTAYYNKKDSSAELPDLDKIMPLAAPRGGGYYGSSLGWADINANPLGTFPTAPAAAQEAMVEVKNSVAGGTQELPQTLPADTGVDLRPEANIRHEAYVVVGKEIVDQELQKFRDANPGATRKDIDAEIERIISSHSVKPVHHSTDNQPEFVNWAK